MIIGVANQKGGPGKSTTVSGYFGAFVELGYHPYILDVDDDGQASVVIGEMGDGILRERTIEAPTDKLEDIENTIGTILEEDPQTNVILIDNGPELGPAFAATSILSDFISVPADNSVQDLALTKNTYSLLDRQQKTVFIQPNKMEKGELVTNEAMKYYRDLAGENILPDIRKATAVKKAGKFGKHIFEFDRKQPVCNDYLLAVKKIIEVVNG